jgi:hypothetical protein
MKDVQISIKDYVDASSSAAKRTRSVTAVVMIASVLMFSGLLNSFQNSWKQQRVRALGNIHSDYVKAKLGVPPPLDTEEYSQYVAHYNQLYSAALKDYLENAYSIRIPFFGISIDVNDLGPIGGLALTVILILYRTSITREIDNLRLSFEGAKEQNQLSTLYYLLAMHQVLTFPNIRGRTRSNFMRIAPKVLVFIPLTIYSMIVLYDFYTLAVMSIYAFVQVSITVLQETLFCVATTVITIMIFKRLKEIDEIWDYYWNIINERKANNEELYAPVPDA